VRRRAECGQLRSFNGAAQSCPKRTPAACGKRGGILGVSLFVERPGRANAISLEKWWKLIADEPDLRLRAEPYAAINPKTGDQVLLPVGLQTQRCTAECNGIRFSALLEASWSWSISPDLRIRTMSFGYGSPRFQGHSALRSQLTLTMSP